MKFDLFFKTINFYFIMQKVICLDVFKRTFLNPNGRIAKKSLGILFPFDGFSDVSRHEQCIKIKVRLGYTETKNLLIDSHIVFYQC